MRVDPQLLALADCSKVTRPCLYVIVDTEEEFNWNAPLSRRNTKVESIRALWRGHEVFRRYGIKPSYLVDYPVAVDAEAQRTLGRWLAYGECLIGAQLHPWVTPPFEEPVCPEYSFACNLPSDLELRKLEVLTKAIQRGFGLTPTVYKAGRYGIDLSRKSSLVRLGYQVDTSVVPHASFAGRGGGPDFFGYPSSPFWAASGAQDLLFLPLSQFLVGPLRTWLGSRPARWIYGASGERLHLPGFLARSGLLERIRLSPEGMSLSEMCRLIDAMLADGQRVFSLSLHSPSFALRGTPYVTSDEDLKSFLDRIDGLLRYFFTTIGGSATEPLALRKMLSSS